MNPFCFIIKKRKLGIDRYSFNCGPNEYSIDIFLPNTKNKISSENILIINEPSITLIKNHEILKNFLYKAYNSSSLDEVAIDINNYCWTWKPKKRSIEEIVFNDLFLQYNYDIKKLDPLRVYRKKLFKKQESATLIDYSQIINEEVERNSELYRGGWKYNGEKIEGDYRIVYNCGFDLTPKAITGKAILCNLPENDQFLLLPDDLDNLEVLEITNKNDLVGLNYKDYNIIYDSDSINKVICYVKKCKSVR